MPAFRTMLLMFLLGASKEALAASTPNWATALPAPAVATYVEGTGVRVMVVPGGTGAADASSALAAALRGSASVSLTLPADSLGDVSKLDDAAIVAKGKGMPVDLIAITRVFPGKNGVSTAVVTFYRTSGEVASAFTAATDAPLVAKAAKVDGSGAAGSMVGGVVDGVVGGNQGDREARIKEFQERAIYMQGWASVDSRSGRVVSTWSVPMKGKYGEMLRGPAFYDYVGKPDDAKTYRSRQRTRGILGATGGALVLGGGAYALLGQQQDPYSPSVDTGPCKQYTDEKGHIDDGFTTCSDAIRNDNDNVVIAGEIVMIVGSVVLFAPLFIAPDPHKTNERERMVDEYNEALMKELGLDTVSSIEADRPAIAEVSAGGWVAPGGGGVMLSGRF